MMSYKEFRDFGGFAFPHTYESGRGETTTNLGMTLRDYLATQAMTALITCAENHGDIPHHLCAIDAYRYADAMLKAREA